MLKFTVFNINNSEIYLLQNKFTIEQAARIIRKHKINSFNNIEAVNNIISNRCKTLKQMAVVTNYDCKVIKQ